jgi:two-component system response regulator GlrR
VSDAILIVDDDEELAEILILELESEGYRARWAADAASALGRLEAERFSLVLLDLRLGDYSGLELFPRIRELAPDTPVVIITAHGDVDSAVDAFRLGACGYVRKPFQEGALKAQIVQAVAAYQARAVPAWEQGGALDEVRAMIRSVDPAMEPLLRRVASAAQVSSNVVITGESGTGKECVARALHACGPRRKGPFVAINMAAVPESLQESELFGYVRGAFTDAKESRPGLFVRAQGGTLFLDEIGDAPPAIQAKLLRVLQEREVVPLGGSAPIRVDARIVAATHRSLTEEVANGQFRQDLYYRLHVVPIQLPALRARPRDVVFLASIFGTRISKTLGVPFEGFTPEAERALEAHPWPGNVRELQNRIEQALALGTQSRLNVASLFPDRAEAPEESEVGSGERPERPAPLPDVRGLPTYVEAKNSFERSYLERLLGQAKGNIAKAARLASKSRTEVYSLLRKHRIEPAAFKPGAEGEGGS